MHVATDNPIEHLQSRLLIRAQELGQLEHIIDLVIEHRVAECLSMLVGMQCGGRDPVKDVETQAAEQELMRIVEWLVLDQGPHIEALINSPSYFTEPTYLQACEMLADGLPEPLVRALLTGWLRGMDIEQPYPVARARILARAIAMQLPELRPKKKKKGAPSYRLN